MDEHQPAMGTVLSAAPHRPETSEVAESRLRRSAYLSLQQLSCDFRAGVLTLRCRLPSYYLKQGALALVATVEGVDRIDDQVVVAVHAAASTPQTTYHWRP
jgi:hypothetical protein